MNINFFTSSSKKKEASLFTPFDVWISSDPHSWADRAAGNNVADASSQLSNDLVSYDFSLNLGDFSAEQEPPSLSDTETGEFVATDLQSTVNPRNNMYVVGGGHDCGNANNDWFLRYVDPLGENTVHSGNDANYPNPITLMEAGSWHSYYFTKGKFMFIMLSDRNELPYPVGRGGTVLSGGHPDAAMSKKTWEWTKGLIESNTDKNILICCHNLPRDTTIATGAEEGTDGNFHGTGESTAGIWQGAGALWTIYDEDTDTYEAGTYQFRDYFINNPNNTVVAWLGGHTHTTIGETYAGRSNHEVKNGVDFCNIGSLTKSHSAKTVHKTSWIARFRADKIIMNQYMHENADGHAVGFVSSEDYEILLKVM